MTTRRTFLKNTGAAAFILPALAQNAQAATHTVTIKNMAFSPAQLTIAAGDTVTWVNEDRARHSAMHLDGAFDTDLLSRGESGSITFNTAGTFDYRCRPHSHMRATVTVA